jgi:hypothetical protein
MFLTSENVVHYLLFRGLVESQEVAGCGLTIQNEGRRNRNFKILIDGKSGLFIKQVPGVFAETTNSIFREALCCDLAESDSRFSSLRPYIARLIDYDPQRHTLTTECLPPCDNLSAFHLRTRSFSEGLAAAFGRALGEIHASSEAVSSPNGAAFPRIPPWVLTIARTAETVFHNMNPATKALVSMLRANTVLVVGLHALGANWRTDTLIHGDVKWDNFLVLRNSLDGGDPQIRIVDWELADLGDASWDVGCAFCAFLQHWLVTMSAEASSLDTRTLVENAPHRLEETWTALKALWRAYTIARGFTTVQAAAELRRAVGFTAARLVLTAFEITMRMPEVSRTPTLCLELATSILACPEWALGGVFGFSANATGVH